MKFLIYSLSCAADGVRYVGVTTQGRKRLSDHIARARAGQDTHKDRWIRSCLQRGVEVVFTVLEEGEGEYWKARESAWIEIIRARGVDLTNLTAGGEGCRGFKHSPETKAAISARRQGRKLTEEHKSKISRALVGRPKSELTKKNMRGRPMTAEHKAKILSALRGRKVSEETRARISASRKGKPISEKARASRPKTLTASHREAISRGLISGRYAR